MNFRKAGNDKPKYLLTRGDVEGMSVDELTLLVNSSDYKEKVTLGAFRYIENYSEVCT